MIRNFKDQVSNAAALKLYRRKYSKGKGGLIVSGALTKEHSRGWW